MFKLEKQIQGYDKENRHHIYSLWHDETEFDILDQPIPKTWTITCRIDGDEACCEHWHGWDFSTHHNKQEAEKEMNWWQGQLNN